MSSRGLIIHTQDRTYRAWEGSALVDLSGVAANVSGPILVRTGALESLVPLCGAIAVADGGRFGRAYPDRSGIHEVGADPARSTSRIPWYSSSMLQNPRPLVIAALAAPLVLLALSARADVATSTSSASSTSGNTSSSATADGSSSSADSATTGSSPSKSGCSIAGAPPTLSLVLLVGVARRRRR